MRGRLLIGLLVSALVGVGQARPAEALDLCGGCGAGYSWHGGYYHVAWGMPVALVVPPIVETQTRWGWGVGNLRVAPLGPQFQRHWPAYPQAGVVHRFEGWAGYDPRRFRPTPHWPSDTEQFGVYYVRGPW